MNGYGSHAYMLVNAAGEKYWVKYFFHTEQGMAFFSNAEAADMAGSDADCHRRDLLEAIASGDAPSCRVSVQVIPYVTVRAYRINQLRRSGQHRVGKEGRGTCQSGCVPET